MLSLEMESVEDKRYLLIGSSRCLAQQGACFACIDHCLQEAVSMALGVGIVIDRELCNGCGECANVCPVNPEIIQLKMAKNESNNPRERRCE